MASYDPWGPISASLYEWNDADFVDTAIRYSGVDVEWPEPNPASGYSNRTRIRSYKASIDGAYNALDEEGKGRFCQTIAEMLVHELINRGRDSLAEKVLAHLSISLGNIGWAIDGNGTLSTQDSTLSERFFPPGSPFDAYVAIRDILETADRTIVIVDSFLSGSLFSTLAAIPARAPCIHLLTNAANLKRDFDIEIGAFRAQYGAASVEVRTASDFHDRFIAIDDQFVYHVGASVKDAGKKAFVISRLEDRPIVTSVLAYIQSSWQAARPR